MPDSQKRMIYTIVASFAFLMVWSKFFAPTPAPVTPVQQEDVVDTHEVIDIDASDSSVEPPSSQNIEPVEQPTIAPETVDVWFDAYEARMSNVQGVIETIVLHDYKQSLDKGAPGMVVVPMTTEDNPAPLLWSFTLDHSNQTLSFDDKTAVYEWIERGENNRYRLRTQVGPVEIEKTYVYEPETYEVHQTVLLRNLQDQPVRVQAQTKIVGSKDPNQPTPSGLMAMFQARKSPVRALAYIDEDVERFEIPKIFEKDAEIPKGPVMWAGFESQYFLLTLIPEKARWDHLELSASDALRASIAYHYPEREIKPNASIEYQVGLVAGPKDIEVLTGIEDGLKYSIDLGGWLGPIARFILRALRMLYGWVHNYGLAIILLTIGVRLLLFPLAQRQAKSMKKMQAHKPQMDALKEQYGEDREAYSRALMQYMKTHKVNPAGGCFPLLVQFPIFFALYRVLLNSIELRHAPFVLWIQDLSAHDPFFVLPVLVGITFYFQTKLNPAPSADPTMQNMMKFMPIMFSAFMIFLPAGLNLYIFISTLWGIVQQYLVQTSKS